jgi:putative ABC transport system permease protein
VEAGVTFLRNLWRHRVRTLLALLGLAVTSAMLLDMILLSGGLERSFEQLLLARGYQIRISPKGTLPFDSEASIGGARVLVDSLRREPGVESVAPLLGTAVYGRRRDSLVTLVGYGVDPANQGMYQVERGEDLDPGDSSGVLVSSAAAQAMQVSLGDTIEMVGGLDPQMARAAVHHDVIVRGIVRWLYDYDGQASVGTVLSTMQQLKGAGGLDRVSFIAVRVNESTPVESVTARLRTRWPLIEVNSVGDLVAHFRERMVYFHQLALILGSISLVVTLLLVSTLLTITVNERLGEIATLRAIGVSRVHIVRDVMLEGVALTVIGGVLGVVLGLATARYLDAILTSFPGLPASISFFVPRTRGLVAAGLVLVASGTLAGAYPAWLAASSPIAATLRTEAT